MRILAKQLLAILVTSFILLGAAKKQKKEEITQTHEILPDPPSAVTVETGKLEFVAVPLSNKGLLSAQTREGLKTLQRLSRGGTIVKIRAWVAGTGDLRRIGTIVSEVFSEKKLPLPAVSVIQIGLLPMEGAQVQLEAVIAARKVVNPHGLMFLSGMGGTGKDPTEKINA